MYESSKAGHAFTSPVAPNGIPSSSTNDAPLESSQDLEKTPESDEHTDSNQVTSTGTTGTSTTLAAESSESSNRTEGKAHHRKPWKLFSKQDKEHDEEAQANGNDSLNSSNKEKPKFTFMSQVRYSIFNSWVNVLLICVPVGIALANIKTLNPIAVFVVNFIAIIPLAGTLSYATEEIAIRTGETIGGLLNATFGYDNSLVLAELV